MLNDKIHNLDDVLFQFVERQYKKTLSEPIQNEFFVRNFAAIRLKQADVGVLFGDAHYNEAYKLLKDIAINLSMMKKFFKGL